MKINHGEVMKLLHNESNAGVVPCETCGTYENVEFAPDPYHSDMRGDNTKVDMCAKCRHASTMEI